MKHLVIAAAWVDAPTPDDATEAVSLSLKGTVIPRSGAVVSIAPHEFASTSGRARLRRDLGMFHLAEAADYATATDEKR